MKITIAQMYAAIAALESLAAQKFAPVTSLKIARISNKLIAERDVADKQRKAMLDEMGTIKEGGADYDFATPAIKQAFFDRWAELCKTEITVHIDKLPFQALGDREVTPFEMQGLEPFLLIEEAALLKPELVKKEEPAQ